MSHGKTIKCGLCHYEFDCGVHVCQGCQGTVVYGATREELADGAKLGAIVWGGGALFLFYALPHLLNSQFGWTISSGWGVGIWGLVIVMATGVWGVMSGSTRVQKSLSGLVRTFRNM